MFIVKSEKNSLMKPRIIGIKYQEIGGKKKKKSQLLVFIYYVSKRMKL